MNASGKNQIPCGSIMSPCSSLSFAINVSSDSDTICLIANPIKQIRYTVENTIIIKHSLTITKFPVYSQNPLITYDLNVTSIRKVFYAFAIFRYALASSILTLNVKSVNFNVNILTTFSKGFKTFQKNAVVRGFQVWLSISDSIVSGTSHTVNFSDISEYENVTIYMKDLIIKSGDFMFKNKRDGCKPLEHIKDIIEMYNVTICNTGNVILSVHGCFNMSIEKLTCSNITWKKRELLIFTGGVLNTKNVLIKNILANKNMKYNKPETKALFLTNESVAEIQNILTKDSVGMSSKRPKRFSAVIIFQNFAVQILNMKMVRNSFGNFVQASKSSLCFKNMTLIENNVAATLFKVEESNVTLHEVKFHRNKIGCVVSINLKSKVLITNNSLIGNEIFEKTYSISRSLMKLINANFRGNKIEGLMLAESQSHIYVDNVTLTNNHVSFRIFHISGESKLKMYNAEFLQNDSPKFLFLVSSNCIIKNNTLIENDFSLSVYDILKSGTLHFNHVAFIRNMLDSELLVIQSNSSAIIQNNTLIGNYVLGTVYDIKESSTIQFNNATFIRNVLYWELLVIQSNSSAIIQNNTLIENDVSGTVYDIKEGSTIQFNNATFIRNMLNWELLVIQSKSTAIIQNNTLIENDVSGTVYDIKEGSTIQLNKATFIRNKLWMLLVIMSNSNVIIQNNTLIENDVSGTLYKIEESSTIQLNHVAFIQNKLWRLILIRSNSRAIIQNNTFIRNTFLRNLLNMVLSSRAKLINNTVVGNSLDQMFFAQSSYLGIDTSFIKSNKFSQLISVVKCSVSFKSMKIGENNVTYGMIYVENSSGRMVNTYIENSDDSLVSAFTFTCTYLRDICHPFEIKNTEIIWSSKIPTSTRPIIQLNGYVSFSNVKVLATSLFETEILQYSTKHDRMSENRFHKTPLPKFSKFSSLFISCTKASVKHLTKAGTFRCIPCARGTYTLNNETLNTSFIILSKKNTKLKYKSLTSEYANFTCLDCPVGTNCASTIKTQSNFYGYETKEKKLTFLPCPRGFCRTGNQCHTINSCNKNRVGTLCGRCTESYVESFLSTDCISIHSCQNFAKFWLAYCIYALILATFLYYMKDFITLIKTKGSNLCKIFKFCKKEKESEGEINMIVIAGSEEHLEKASHFTVSGIFTLIVSYYQIKQLMNVDVQYKNSTDFSFVTFIADCLNLEMVAVTYSSYCTMSNLDAVSKAFIKSYLLTATLIMAALINYFITRVLHFFSSKLGRISSLKASERLGVFFIRILMLSYKSMASATLILLNCVEVSGVGVLFIQGDMKCYQWWQMVLAVFFSLGFCFSLCH